MYEKCQNPLPDDFFLHIVAPHSRSQLAVEDQWQSDEVPITLYYCCHIVRLTFDRTRHRRTKTPRRGHTCVDRARMMREEESDSKNTYSVQRKHYLTKTLYIR
jgi:uncharacterized protein with von Willebrand factor type A (vWA) domain